MLARARRQWGALCAAWHGTWRSVGLTCVSSLTALALYSAARMLPSLLAVGSSLAPIALQPCVMVHAAMASACRLNGQDERRWPNMSDC